MGIQTATKTINVRGENRMKEQMPLAKLKTLNASTIFLLGFCFLTSLSLFAATQTVGATGANFTSIQAAVTAAANGDVISVAAGTYQESVKVENKSLTIQGAGAGPGAVKIMAQGTIPADNILSGDGLSRATIVAVISTSTATPASLTLKNLTVNGNDSGASNANLVGVGGFAGATLSVDNCWVVNVGGTTDLTGIAIGAFDSGNLSVRDCGKIDTFQKAGISVNGSLSSVSITGNKVTGTGVSTTVVQNGISVEGTATAINATISNNVVKDVSFMSTGAATQNDLSSGIALINCANSTVSRNTVIGNTTDNTIQNESGINIQKSNGVRVTNNTLVNLFSDIILDGAVSNGSAAFFAEITFNDIIEGGQAVTGFQVNADTDNDGVTTDEIFAIANHAVDGAAILVDSAAANISNNNILGNGTGIHLLDISTTAGTTSLNNNRIGYIGTPATAATLAANNGLDVGFHIAHETVGTGNTTGTLTGAVFDGTTTFNSNDLQVDASNIYDTSTAQVRTIRGNVVNDAVTTADDKSGVVGFQVPVAVAIEEADSTDDVDLGEVTVTGLTTPLTAAVDATNTKVTDGDDNTEPPNSVAFTTTITPADVTGNNLQATVNGVLNNIQQELTRLVTAADTVFEFEIKLPEGENFSAVHLNAFNLPQTNFTITKENGVITLTVGSPALTVSNGAVVNLLGTIVTINGVVTSSIQATNTATSAAVGDFSTIVIENGGTLKVRNVTIGEATNFTKAAIQIEGNGKLDLGTTTDPGNNTITVNGLGNFILHLGTVNVNALGNTWIDNSNPADANKDISTDNTLIQALISNTDGTTTGSATVTVLPAVNDAPTFVKGADVTVSQNTGGQTVFAWATDISAGLVGTAVTSFTPTATTITGVDASSNAVTTAGAFFSAAPTVNATTGDLKFTIATGVTGTAVYNLTATDNGGTTGGGIETSAAQSFSITVIAGVVGGGGVGTVPSGNLAHWALNEAMWAGTAGEVDDSSSANNDGTAKNGAQTAPVTDNTVNTSITQAGDFNATGSVITIDNGSSIVTNTNGDLTLAAWIKTSTAGGLRQIVGKSDFGQRGSFGLILSGGSPIFYVDGSVPGTFALGPASVATGSWVHLAGVYSNASKSVNLYVNGVSVREVTLANAVSLNTDNSVPFTIGGDGGANKVNSFPGLIADVHVFSTAESAANIDAIRTNGVVTGPPATGFAITSVGTADIDSDGKIDALLFTFSAAINDTTFTAALTSGALTIAGTVLPSSAPDNLTLDGDTDNNKIVVEISEAAAVNSGASFSVAYDATTGAIATSLGGTPILLAATTLTTTDAAKPVILSASINYETNVRQLSVVVSENLTVTDLSKFHLNDVTGTDIVSLNGATATVSASAPWTINAKLTLSQLQNALAISSDGDVGSTVSADPTVGIAGAVVLDVDSGAISDVSTAGNKNVTKDNTAVVETLDMTDPLVTSVTATTGTFGPGDIIAVKVTFDEIVKVTGTPTINLDLASPDVTTTVIDGSGTSELTFSYTVKVGDSTTTGTFVEVLAGITGTVVNLGGNGATTNASFDATGVKTLAGNNVQVSVVGTSVTARAANGTDTAFREGQQATVIISANTNGLQSLIVKLTTNNNQLQFVNNSEVANTGNANVANIDIIDVVSVVGTSTTDHYITISSTDGLLVSPTGNQDLVNLNFNIVVGAQDFNSGVVALDLSSGSIAPSVNETGASVSIAVTDGTITLDSNYIPLDVDENGAVTSATDGAYIFKAALYGGLNGLVPITGFGTTSDVLVIANVTAAGASGSFDVDSNSSFAPGTDAVYIFKNLRGDAASVPADHTANVANEAAINTKINALKAEAEDTLSPAVTTGLLDISRKLAGSPTALEIRFNEFVRIPGGTLLTTANISTVLAALIDVSSGPSTTIADYSATVNTGSRVIILTPNSPLQWVAGNSIGINANVLEDVAKRSNGSATIQ